MRYGHRLTNQSHTELRQLTVDGVELGLTPIGNFLLIGREPITAEYLDRAEELASRLDAV